jgi:uncharacterized membrane protein YdfJ with MMPL/SSD domain
MIRFLDALGRFSVRFRYPIVLVWLTGAVAATQPPSLPPEPEPERADTTP